MNIHHQIHRSVLRYGLGLVNQIVLLEPLIFPYLAAPSAEIDQNLGIAQATGVALGPVFFPAAAHAPVATALA